MAADDDLHEVAKVRLRAVGLRYTGGRRDLVSALAAAEGPLTLPQLLGAAPALVQSSAYRNLSELEAAGVAHRIVTDDDHARYELSEDLTEHHHHLICRGCGSVTDFTLPDDVEDALDAALGRAAASERFETARHRLDLLGRCRDCTDRDV